MRESEKAQNSIQNRPTALAQLKDHHHAVRQPRAPPSPFQRLVDSSTLSSLAVHLGELANLENDREGCPCDDLYIIIYR